MKRRIAFAVLLCALITAKAAFAHRIDEYLQATLLTMERDHVRASMRLIPGVLVASSVIDAIDSDHDGTFSEAEERAYAQRVVEDLAITLDEKPVRPLLGAFSFPQPSQLRDGLGEIHIDYTVDLPIGGLDRTLTLVNQHLRANSVYLVNVLAPQNGDVTIVSQKRNQQQSVYELDFQQTKPPAQTSLSALRSRSEGLQLSSLFHLGMRHIAEGTDHLLFLLVLLLPAPLCAVGGRWAAANTVRKSLLHIVGIVTAFTIGHSLTLTLAAMGMVHIPGQPVEVFIAVSILVSAMHALRPIFPGKEAWIAACFGLVHGLAFASTLDRLGLARWDRLAGILAFNLGIETMQMVVVAITLPSLLIMSRTLMYRYCRVGGAVLAAIASIAWISERLFDIQTPVDSIVDAIARHGFVMAVLLLAASLACRYLPAAMRRA
jgi:hypothetical protein